MTIIEIRPFRNGWQVFETAGLQPVLLDQEQTIDDYAKGRAAETLIRLDKLAGFFAELFNPMA